MGLKDKAENTAEGLKGSAKKQAGRTKEDPDMEAEGKVEKTKADVKQAGEKVKDAFKG